MSRKVLIFTYYWPPSGGAGVQRYLKFAKYLKEFDWEPIVITPENPTVPYYDNTLADDIHPSMTVIKTKSFEPFKAYNILTRNKKGTVSHGYTGLKDNKSIIKRLANYIRANFFIPDARKGWKKFAVEAAIKLIEKENIDAILTTGPPHSAHLIGLSLKEQFNLPWVADMRDPWTNIYYNKMFPRTASTERKDKRLEDTVIKSADRVVVISPGLKDEFSDRNKNIKVIYNGFDSEDMFHKLPEQSEKFTLSYVGNYKPNQNCEALWKVLSEFAKEEDFRKRFRICFTGIVDPTVMESIIEYNIESLVEVEGFVPHHEATQRMQAANMLLFIVPNTSGNKLILTGKIFEYLATRRPILSIGPKSGNASDVISEAGRDPMVDYLSREDIKKQILHYYIDWKKNNGRMQVHKGDAHLRYSRKSLTSELATLLNEAVENA